ncbi:hypothetical protein L1049_026747 [Liquidambar formosana]|uniref:DUF4378 domain-containing protein n=1 Tax=Liquidambar formosana TaxID=63359 RepID=A0AAP0NDY5_LIQFO
MASTMPKTVKQLGELLQEQQDPFILEIYLQERGYLKKSLSSEDNSGSCHGNSNKFLKRSASCGPNKSRKGMPHCSKILQAVFNKLVSINENLRVKHSHGDGKFSVTEKGRNNQEAAEPERFSSSSSTTVFNSCSETDIEETSTSSHKDHISSAADTFQASSKFCDLLREKEVATDRKLQWRTVEDMRHHYRTREEESTSTLNCILSEKVTEGSIFSASLSNKTARHNSRTRQEGHTSTSNFILHRKVTEDAILSASFWELLLQSPAGTPICIGVAELQELAQPNASSHHLKSKRVLQQTKQLLFDCVREVAETHGGKERKQQQGRPFLEPEELGKLICEEVGAWGKQNGDETNITQLLHVDFLASAKEWSEFEPLTKEIAMEIGDAVWEEISNEIVNDMINIFGAK